MLSPATEYSPFDKFMPQTAPVKRVTDVANPLLQPAPAKQTKLVNYIALVLDVSSSMARLIPKLRELANEQIATLKQAAHSMKQDVRLTVITFSDHDYIKVVRNEFIHAIEPFGSTELASVGQTALVDAVAFAADHLKAAIRPDFLTPTVSHDRSFLVITLTDGIENDSRWNSDLGKVIREASPRNIATEETRWSFAFLTPDDRGRDTLINFGVPAGNIRIWETTEAGLEEASVATSVGTRAYLDARSKGKLSTQSFYTDLGGLKPGELSRNLDDLTSHFRRYVVGPEQDISSFVSKQTGAPYRLGAAYYELTKPETVQSHKDVLIEDRVTKRLFGGQDARRLLGLPEPAIGTSTKVIPGNHSTYRIFVQSTSVNRKLVRGTTVLYSK